MADLAYRPGVSHGCDGDHIDRRPCIPVAFETTQPCGNHFAMQRGDSDAIHGLIMTEAADFPAARTDVGSHVGNKTVANHAICSFGVFLMEFRFIAGGHLTAMAYNASVAFGRDLQIPGLRHIRVVTLIALSLKRAWPAKDGALIDEIRVALLTVESMDLLQI